MKKLTIIAMLLLVAGMLILCTSCGGGEAGETASSDTQAQTSSDSASDTALDSTVPSDASVIGIWALPESEWLEADKAEYWQFFEDGSFKSYSTDSTGKAVSTLDGSYKTEGSKLTLTLAGFPLEYSYTLMGEDSMLRSDHGTDVVLTRYKGEIQ